MKAAARIGYALAALLTAAGAAAGPRAQDGAALLTAASMAALFVLTLSRPRLMLSRIHRSEEHPTGVHARRWVNPGAAPARHEMRPDAYKGDPSRYHGRRRRPPGAGEDIVLVIVLVIALASLLTLYLTIRSLTA